MAYGLEVLARLAFAEGGYDRVLRLAGAVSSQRSQMGTANMVLWQEVVDRDIERARRILGPERSAQEWAQGGAMTWDEAVDLGLATRAEAGAVPVAKDIGPLSRREWQIGELVAKGLKNAEIAEYLHISKRPRKPTSVTSSSSSI